MASTDVVHLNLDTAEREDKFETFAVVIHERRVEISDPAEIDFKDLLQIENSMQFLRYCMSQEDRDWLAEENLKGWELGLLLESFLKHYRATERIDERLDQRKRLGF